MTPTVLNFPSVANPARITWQLNRLDTRFKSPLSGTFQDIQRPGANWVCDMSWGVLSYADSQQLAAWSDQMSQAGVRTYLPNFVYIPQGSSRGVVIVNGANQTGTSLVCNQAPVGTNLVVAGDFIVITSGTHTQLLRITQNSSSDGSGNITLNFTPAMRFSPANGSQIFIGVTPTVTPAVYKSDWQGNQLQYSTPRTNTAEWSITPGISGHWSIQNLTLSSATAIIPGGTAGKVTGTGAFSSFQPSLLVNPSGLNTWSVIIENVSEITTLLGIYDDTQALEVSYYSYTWGTGIVAFTTGYAPDHSATVQNLGTGPNGGKLIKFSVSGTGATGKTISAYLYPDAQSNTSNVLIVHSAQFETDSNATSIISTTTSPVTVTDYTLAGNQLTFASAPANASTLTWTDGAGTIFHLPSGDGSTTVFYTGLPLVAFAFAKPSSSFTYTAPRIAALSLALEEDINV